MVLWALKGSEALVKEILENRRIQELLRDTNPNCGFAQFGQAVRQQEAEHVLSVVPTEEERKGLVRMQEQLLKLQVSKADSEAKKAEAELNATKDENAERLDHQKRMHEMEKERSHLETKRLRVAVTAEMNRIDPSGRHARDLESSEVDSRGFSRNNNKYAQHATPFLQLT